MRIRSLGLAAMLVLMATESFAAPPTISWTLFAAPAASGKGPVDAGKAAFENACAVCHAAQPDRPGTMSLQFKYAGRIPAALEQRTDLTPQFVTYYIRHGIAMMPSFRKTELSDAQVAAIAAYLSHKK